MPVLKSAIKKARQDKKAYERNKHYNSKMRTLYKNIIKETDPVKAEGMLNEAVSAVDTALKKKLIHRNNAAHKKSRLMRIVAALKIKGAPPPKEKFVKKEKKAVAPKTKTAAKVTKKATAQKKTTVKK